MNTNLRDAMYCIISAFGFSIWPVLSRYATTHYGSASSAWTALIVLGGAAVMNIAFNSSGFSEIPDRRVLMILGVAFVLDATAIVLYTALLGGKSSFTGLMTANIILQVVFTALSGTLILGEPMTKRKLIGYAFGAIASWLLLGEPVKETPLTSTELETTQ
ncbi:MAG: EamA family transporter [Patescibacteria group bacterium]|jgi:drug/metabolite transporter (DMT)-like permease